MTVDEFEWLLVGRIAQQIEYFGLESVSHEWVSARSGHRPYTKRETTMLIAKALPFAFFEAGPSANWEPCSPSMGNTNGPARPQES